MEPWAQAAAAAALLAVDPAGLGGVSLRALPGPVRDAWLALARGLLPAGTPWRRVPLGIADSRLLGGLDLTATLAAGRPVAERGLLAETDGGILVLAMAERIEPGTAARIAATLDTGEGTAERDGLTLRTPTRFGVIALDEAAAPEEAPPAALLDRLAFRLDLAPIPARAIAPGPDPAEIAAARARLPRVTAGEDVLEALVGTAAALGIASLRAPILALRAARAAAALAGKDAVGEAEAALAARLVLGPRATRLPAEETPEEPEPPPPEPPQDQQQDPEDQPPPPPEPEVLEEMLVAAVAASLPPNLLALLQLQAGRQARTAGKAGQQARAPRRGRPIGARQGALRGGARLALIETLRAAAPWQGIRRQPGDAPGRVRVLPDDIRIRRFRQRSETATIFCVDASGSSALNRLSEAKGAVELLLADCYVRRDKVAVIAFRGQGAELLLPPTSSLVRAKRSLAGLPGGGGTPIAAALDAALALADAVKRRGATPLLILLTDGRANVARDGKGGRARAEAEALAAGRALAAARIAALVVDTGPRPTEAGRSLAAAMACRYLPLPRADAATLSRAVRLAA